MLGYGGILAVANLRSLLHPSYQNASVHVSAAVDAKQDQVAGYATLCQSSLK